MKWWLVLVLSAGCVPEEVDPVPVGSGASGGGWPRSEGGGGGEAPLRIAALRSSRQNDPRGSWRFEEVAQQAGLVAKHNWDPSIQTAMAIQYLSISGGAAAGDVNDDGYPDLFVTGCELGKSALYLNRQDGTFADVTVSAGIEERDGCDAGPIFGDFDGDGADDLFIGGVLGTPVRLLVQRQGAFVDRTAEARLDGLAGSIVGGALADIDGDGDSDLFLGRWLTSDSHGEHVFLNKGGGEFVPWSTQAGLAGVTTFTFTPNLVDIDEDGVLDLLFASDFHTSRVFLGRPGGTFEDATTPVISDENGMGAAIGDVDGDGHFDWFVSSVWDPTGIPQDGWGVHGNRLYRNAGGGQFVDATTDAGVREGYWGWGSCFADFDNDGDLDLFHTNGFNVAAAAEFHHDPSRLFINEGQGTFTERSAELGIVDTGQGRGVVCFDYDRDGDVDILVQNNRGPILLYRNNGALSGHWLDVAFAAPPPNARAIGARVEIEVGSVTRIGLVRAGSNYASQDPAEVHFGVGAATSIDRIVVKRPGRADRVFEGPFEADRRVVLELQD